MGRLSMGAVVAATIVAFAPPVKAGVYADDLAKCLVRAANSDDQKSLILWLFSAMSAHPYLNSTAALTEAKRDANTHKAGLLFQRLMTVDCRRETVSALKYEGSSALEAGFGVLGQVAMRGIMNDPAVQQGVAKLSTDLDEKAFAGLMTEAGLVPKR